LPSHCTWPMRSTRTFSASRRILPSTTCTGAQAHLQRSSHAQPQCATRGQHSKPRVSHICQHACVPVWGLCASRERPSQRGARQATTWQRSVAAEPRREQVCCRAARAHFAAGNFDLSGRRQRLLHRCAERCQDLQLPVDNGLLHGGRALHELHGQRVQQLVDDAAQVARSVERRARAGCRQAHRSAQERCTAREVACEVVRKAAQG
jgi:hypothetical protein